MEISALMAVSASGAASPSGQVPESVTSSARPIPPDHSSPTGTDPGTVAVIANGPESTGNLDSLTSTIDRMRARFQALSQQASNAQPASAVVGQSAALDRMEHVMNQSIRMQAEIFQMAVNFHAGLTVTQQSQNGVKTLVEKS